MEKLENEKKLPDVFVLEDDFRKCRTTWMAVLGGAQRAYDELLNDRDVGDCLPEFEKLDSAWIKDFVSKKIDAVMQSPNTYNARIEAANEWHKLEKDLLQKVAQIERLRQIDPKAVIEAKGCHVLISNMEELLKERNTYVVPEWFKDYYGLIVEAANMVERLNAFEVQHQVRTPIKPFGVLSFAVRPEDFIKHLIFEEKMKDVEVPLSYAQAKLNAQHDKAQAKENAEKNRLFEEGRAEKIRKGEQVDFAVSIKTVDCNCIPAGLK